MKIRAVMNCVVGRRYLSAGEIADMDWPENVALPSSLEEIGKKEKSKKAIKAESDADNAEKQIRI